MHACRSSRLTICALYFAHLIWRTLITLEQQNNAIYNNKSINRINWEEGGLIYLVTYKTRICGKIPLELVCLAFIIKTGSSAAGMILHGCSWRFQTSREFIFQLFDSTFLAYASFLASSFSFYTRRRAWRWREGYQATRWNGLTGTKKKKKKSIYPFSSVFFFAHFFLKTN